MSAHSLARPLFAFAWIAGLTMVPAVRADEPARTDQKGADRQRVDGVVVKAERIGEGQGEKSADRDQGVRLTINTAAVWRDYVRDTATSKATSPEKAAKKGEESIATKGQPKSDDTLVTVEIPRDARREMRYRAAMDERTLGAPTPAQARRRLADEADDRADGAPTKDAKTVEMNQLKPGLFVTIQYRRDRDRNRADRLFVLEPVRDEAGR